MNRQTYRFTCGKFNMLAISDGVFPVSREFFFANTPEEIIKQFPSMFGAPLNFLLIDTGSRLILVDTGFGTNSVPEAGKLIPNLKTQGIPSEDIDIVVITHGHMDHIGGVSENGVPCFPNAQYVIRKAEWEQWTKNPESDEYKKLIPLREKVCLIESDTELIPGIHLIHSPGHTVGNLSLTICSEGQVLMVASDILNDPLNLRHLDSHIAVEMSPEIGLETRKKFLQTAKDTSALLFVCHFPFPGLGQRM
ncbi:MBL fold metallo-hydrolase [Ectobacillus panaciterrae]|uniref:MBL fold metallo-hydrolase n=1 Tax=Ectobacillus panaciterrae TaxID=363872 RepID=UPI0004011A50|nr:MBL fold metallo-hydrolase [Ectobacillus panaciterrae]